MAHGTTRVSESAAAESAESPARVVAAPAVDPRRALDANTALRLQTAVGNRADRDVRLELRDLPDEEL